jgi:hypothetical protein
MGSVSSPLYRPELHRSHDAKLAAMSDALDDAKTRDPKQRTPKWVKSGSSNANKDRLKQWAAASAGARTALEEQWEEEDAAEEDAKKKAADAEAARRQKLAEARAALRR